MATRRGIVAVISQVGYQVAGWSKVFGGVLVALPFVLFLCSGFSCLYCCIYLGGSCNIPNRGTKQLLKRKTLLSMNSYLNILGLTQPMKKKKNLKNSSTNL
jgi:hypothetical protein